MSLVFISSFDANDDDFKWTTWSAANNYVAGRTDTAVRLDCNNNACAIKDIGGSRTRLIVGGAVFQSATGSLNGWLLGESTGTDHVRVKFDADNTRIDVFRGTSTLLGSSAASTFLANTWQFVEVDVTVHDTTGSVGVWVNGTQVINLTNVDTRNGGAGIIDRFHMGSNSGQILTVDDFYIIDTAGSVNNGRLGNSRVRAKYPNGDSTPLELTPSTGSDHFALIDENPPVDTDYNGSAVDGDIDMYDYENLADTTHTIFGIQIGLFAGTDDAGVKSMRSRIDSGTVETGDDHSLSLSYVSYFDLFETDPNTSALWTPTNFNAANFGVEVRP